MVESQKIIQCLWYILSEITTADKLKLVKLTYLADKYHLLRYGRTITNDEYWAMSYGPVGSVVKDILGFDPEFLSNEYEYAAQKLKKLQNYTFQAVTKCDREDLDLLSDTDIECLSFIIEKFGHFSIKDLIDYTHKYPEWSQYKALFDRKEIRREKIEVHEVVSIIENDFLSVDPRHIEESRNVLNGTFL
jgi:uncharacterized phage-associated protein